MIKYLGEKEIYSQVQFEYTIHHCGEVEMGPSNNHITPTVKRGEECTHARLLDC